MDYLISISDQLAPQLRSLRKVRRLSQADLALKLGVTQSRIAAIERNPSAVSAGQLLDLLKVLGVDLVLRDTPAPVGATSPVSDISDTGPKGAW
ncbi:helix-turn-helix domain-containing protein [Hydrogenophaga sp.]|uniref:helix-turn-helix domain-containing protein n=1 Tax=Hydrogenophaga sp. TaxID=1904254 RepID=UPI00271BA366|nr:helix-turn-helix transcriptional regulator [Hydrogenophaga sp.]MDO9436202.1 helix-turn-helix transcriptional regulator [Hydrogenophaga sp.]